MYRRSDSTLRIPPASDALLWRYMPFERLAAMLETQSLWFTRVDHFRDPYESELPRNDRKLLQRKILLDPNAEIAEVRLADYRGNPGPFAAREIGELMRTAAGVAQLLRRSTFVNCWHANSHEDAGMWDRYGKQGEGVAVTTTLDRLIASVADEPRPIDIAHVEYMDYRVGSILDKSGELNHFLLCCTKRDSFSQEQEVRLITLDASKSGPTIRGVALRCDITALVRDIYIDPDAMPVFVKSVRATAKQYGLIVRPIKSDLYTPLAH